MGSDLRLTGLHVPLITPFDAGGGVDVDAVERLAAECVAGGAAGLVALATTGEATSLDEGERRAVVDACARVCTDTGTRLIVGAGTNDTRATIRRHEALADVTGVAASLAVVPYYVRPTPAAVVEHFRVVAGASPVPVVAYNIPYRTGVGLDADDLLELAAIDGVAGVKQAVGGVDADTLRVLAEAPDDFTVLGGDDPYLAVLALMGAGGAIAASAHLCTDRYSAMLAAAAEGDVATTRRHAEALLPLALALFAEPSPAIIKAVLHAEGRIPTPDVRMPLGNASPAAVAAAVAVLGRARSDG